MTGEKPCFQDFLTQVDPEIKPAVIELHEHLLGSGYKVKVESAKSGYVVSYPDARGKATLANYVFRKKGLIMRLYGDHVMGYCDYLHTLPKSMIKAIEKASACRRMLNPDACNPRCGRGYDFILNDLRQQKCRYTGFMFLVDRESMPFIRGMLDREMAQRAAKAAIS